MLNFNRAFPERRIRTKSRSDAFELRWFNDELRQMREILNMLRDMSLVGNDVAIRNAYKCYRVRYKNKLKHAKIESTGKYINDASNKVKAAWNVINMYQNGRRPKKFTTLTINELNAFFVNSVEAIVNNIPQNTIAPCELLPTKVFPGFSFRPITTNDVRRVIRGMRRSRSRDLYGLTAIPILSSAEALLKPLTDTINSSIKTGTFPDALKAAIVIPISKKLTDEYRPISILPIISKILKRYCFCSCWSTLKETEFFLTHNAAFGLEEGHRMQLSCYWKTLCEL